MIGIITFQRTNNYGGALQCYALYTFLTEQGYDVEVIDYKNFKIDSAYSIFPYFRKNFIKWGIEFLRRLCSIKYIRNKRNEFEEFYKSIDYSEKMTHRQIVKKGVSYDILIAGSDQIWNSSITRGLDDVYLLNFPLNGKKIAYAVSIGSVNNEESKSQRFKQALDQFNKISLREEDIVAYLNNLINRDVSWCVDPTFLLKRDDWTSLAKKKQSLVDGKYILIYFLEENQDLIKIAKHLSKIKKCKLVSCNEKITKGFSDVVLLRNCGPLDFLNLVYNAESVVTSSFHATVFSIIFEKNMYLALHSKTGSRIISLCKLIKADDRIYTNFEDFLQRYKEDKMLLNYSNLFEQISTSKKFILDSLKDEVQGCN